MNRAVYPGSFNPWTKGHQDILDRALTIFDEVTIVVAKNPSKDINTEAIKETLVPVAGNINYKFKDSIVKVVCHEGLISDLKLPIIRGVRSGDWEYEQNLAMWNKELGVETVFLCPNPANSHISSSALRLLHSEGIPIERYSGNIKSIMLWLKLNKIN